jgi:hypothetical protein
MSSQVVQQDQAAPQSERLLDEIDEAHEEEQEGYADWWEKESEPEVEGMVIDRRTAKIKKPRPGEDPEFSVLELRSQDGSRVSLGCNAHQLREAIRQKDPQRGDTVAVKYFGQVPKSDGNGTFGDFTMIVARARTDAEEESVAATQEARQHERDELDAALGG